MSRGTIALALAHKHALSHTHSLSRTHTHTHSRMVPSFSLSISLSQDLSENVEEDHRACGEHLFSSLAFRVYNPKFTSNGFKNVRTENGSSHGQNLALAGLLVPSSLDGRSEDRVGGEERSPLHYHCRGDTCFRAS